MYRRVAKANEAKRYHPAHYVPRLLGVVAPWQLQDDRTSCLTTSACCSLATPKTFVAHWQLLKSEARRTDWSY